MAKPISQSATNAEETIQLKLGLTAPQVFTLWKSDHELIKELFPTGSFQLRNGVYPAVSALSHNGDRQDFYFRRTIADLMLREAGVSLAKGYTIETDNGDPCDLRRENLKIVTTRELLNSSSQPRKNGWHTHHNISIRLRALKCGHCPDEAISTLAAKHLSQQAANDNQKPTKDSKP